MANGMDFVLNSKCRRIQITQQPVADGGFLLDDGLDLADIDLLLRDGAEKAQVVQAIRRYIFGAENFRAAEKVSLEINEPGRLGRDKFFASLDLLRQQAAPPRPVFFHDGGAFFHRGLANVDLRMSAKSVSGARGSSILKSSSAIT